MSRLWTSSVTTVKKRGEKDPAMNSIETEEWDDNLLIDSWNKSVKLTNEEVARRLAMATNSQSSDSETKIKSEKETTSKELAHNGPVSEEPEPVKYKAGDYCRATFQDGVDYEAKIVEILGSTGKCLLRYIGYENEEWVRIGDLIPSWGKPARKQQTVDAKCAQEGDAAELNSDMHPDKSSARNKTQRPEKRNRIKFSEANVTLFSSTNAGERASTSNLIPPPPPMPPMLNEMSEDSEHLSAMLMSWYMSGYYTGLYQGQKMSRKRSRNQKI